MAEYYTSHRIIDGKPRRIIVDEIGKIVNRNPTKVDLKGLKNYTEDNGKYRISVSFDKENFFDVAVNNGKFIRYPTKEDLKGARTIFYNPTNICPICSEEWERGEILELKDSSILYPGNAFRLHHQGKEERKIEGKICENHYDRGYERYYPNSHNNAKKSLADHRTGNLNDARLILADKGEELTDKVFGTKRLSVLYDKYSRLSLDHTPIPEGVSITIGGKLVDLSGKRPETKICLESGQEWKFSHLEKDRNKIFDIAMFWCASKDRLRIDRGYIMTKEEEMNGSFHIYKNSSKGFCNEKYRITDEEFVNKANEAWKEINK